MENCDITYVPVDVEAIVAVFLHPATEGVEVRRLAVQRVGNIVVVAAEIDGHETPASPALFRLSNQLTVSG